jgi:hypothetical protein
MPVLSVLLVEFASTSQQPKPDAYTKQAFLPSHLVEDE